MVADLLLVRLGSGILVVLAVPSVVPSLVEAGVKPGERGGKEGTSEDQMLVQRARTDLSLADCHWSPSSLLAFQ